MAIVLDDVTRAAYMAQPLAASRASLVVSALTGTVAIEVRDGLDQLRASGTMASPWATVVGSTITVGQVTGTGLTVTSGGVPDATWYCQFRAGTKFVRGTFGVATSSADFRWSLPTFTTGSKGTLSSVVLTALDSGSLNHLTYLGDPIITRWDRNWNPDRNGLIPTTVGQIAQAYPAARDRSYLNSTAAEYLYKTTLRQYWERRDGLGAPAVPVVVWPGNAPYEGSVYSVSPADAGKQIRVREATTDKDGTSTVYSPWFSIANAARDPELVYPEDLTYTGSFRGPSAYDYLFTKYGGYGMTFDPAGNGGNGSLFMAGRYGWPPTNEDLVYPWGEITIPTPANTPTFTALPVASFTARNPSPIEATEGQLGNSGIPNNLWRSPVGGLVYNNKLIITGNVGYATRVPATTWRRPLTLATTGQVEGPVWLNAPYITAREGGARMCHVPPAWQSALGGPVLAGAVTYSLNQSASHGPGAYAFDPDNIAGKTFISGTLPDQTGMALDQIKLPATASGALTGRSLGITGGTGFAIYESWGVYRIVAWDNTTKIATVSPGRVQDAVLQTYDSTTTFKIFESIPAIVSLFYPLGDNRLDPGGNYYGLYDFAPGVWADGTNMAGMCIPNGTRTLLAFGVSPNGFLRYNNDVDQYDPIGAQKPRGYPYILRIWAYDLNHLAAVKAGQANPWSVRPYAVWSQGLPYSPAHQNNRSVCYDAVNRRIFVFGQFAGDYGEGAIHTLRVNNAVAA